MNWPSLLCSLFLSVPVLAQQDAIGVFKTTGNITAVCSEGIIWQAFGNSANLANVQSNNILFSNFLPYSIKALSEIYFGGNFKINKNSGAIITIQQSGFGLIEHQQIKAGYGLKLTEQFNAGIKLRYHRWQQGSDYPTISLLTPELCALIKLNKQLTLGSQLLIGNTDVQQPINSSLKVGIRYQIDDALALMSEILSAQNNRNFSFGIYYKASKQVHVNLGVETQNSSFSLGVTAIAKSNLYINSGFVWNNRLGVSPAITLLYSFK